MTTSKIGLLLLAACATVYAAQGTPSLPLRTKSQSAVGRTALVEGTWHITVASRPYQLSFTEDAFSFCDKRGARSIDLNTGVQTASTKVCRKDEGSSSACPNLTPGVSVSSPSLQTELNDYVESGNVGYTVKGGVEDCQNIGKILIVGTGFQVVAIDGVSERVAVLDGKGSDRVAIGPGWFGWRSWDGRHLTLLSREAAFKKTTKR